MIVINFADLIYVVSKTYQLEIDNPFKKNCKIHHFVIAKVIMTQNYFGKLDIHSLITTKLEVKLD